MHNLLPKEKKRFSYGSSSMEANSLHEKKPALPGTIAKYRNTALERGFTEISQHPSLRG
jgi:hypothetical protein